MSAEQVQRPNFFEGQYLGAADLDLAVEYNRFALARHALGAHTWGIVVGLELVAIDSAGSKDVYVQPGMAIDGFGRQIIVNEAVKLTAELFDDVASSLSGNCTVWIRFSGEPFSSPSGGLSNCEDNESFARLQEGYEIIVTSISNASTSDQNDPIVIAGESIDAMEAPVAGDPSNIHCDASVPYQTFPSTEEDPERCWLVPLGYVKWDFSSGTFDPDAPIDLASTRRYRRYLGSVTEGILAADGLIRLRRRDRSLAAGESASTACALPALEATDLSSSNDPIDLVWVEGHMRVIGDTKLFGGQLDLRRLDGEMDGTSLLARRVESNSLAIPGKDLQLVIGSATSGKNRLAIGPVVSDSDLTLQDKLVVLDNGKVGVQVSEPNHDLQVGDGKNPVFVALRGSKDTASSVLAFENSDADDGFRLEYDAQNNRLLLLRANDDQVIAAFVKDGPKVGIRTSEPDVPLHVFGTNDDDASASAGGLMVIGDVDGRNVVLDNNEIMARNDHEASTLYLQNEGGELRVHNNAGSTSQKFIIDANGSVGIGTTTPEQKLDVRGEIRLGSSTDYFAASALETAHIIAGRVNSDGNGTQGEGFSAVWIEQGKYRVTFGSAFEEIPSVVVTPVSSSNDDHVVTVRNQTTQRFEVWIKDVVTIDVDTFQDTAFNFIAIGRR